MPTAGTISTSPNDTLIATAACALKKLATPPTASPPTAATPMHCPSMPRAAPRLWNDRDKLVQVVTNLLSNSIKFTPQGGRIWINAKKVASESTDRPGEKLEICVSDTGIGIPQSEYENIFQKFTQVGEKLLDKPTGTGLGLPICKEIVEFFGGEIWVKSTPGKGSSFYFTVPVRAEERVREPETKL